MTANIKRSYPRCEQLCQQGRVNCSCLNTANSDGSSPHGEARDLIDIALDFVAVILVLAVLVLFFSESQDLRVHMFEAIKEAFKAAISRYRFVRFQQSGGNPDNNPYF